jgi:two-component system LytT family response regulator
VSGEVLTAVVVDDEERARRRLVRLLAEVGGEGVRLLAEAGDGAAAVAAVVRHAPDLVFLDVQMPDLDGFGVLAQLPRPPRYVVFTTAYDRYALDAFTVGALDYLLKPFGAPEVARALDRARERRAEARFRDGYARLVAALDRPRFLERLPVEHRHDIVLVPVGDVTHFEAEGELVAVNAPGARYYTDLTLAELEARLDPDRFFRAHRSAIINLARVLRLQRVEGGRLLALLGDEVRVEVSRQASRRLREKLFGPGAPG